MSDRDVIDRALDFIAKSPKPIGPDLAEDVREFLRSASVPRVIGVSRDAENPQAIIVSFSSVLSDDDLRAFHDSIRTKIEPTDRWRGTPSDD